MARYGKKSQESVKKVMHEFKRGKLKSGKSGKKVKNPKQAVAIGLSEARAEGEKVPPPPKRRRKKTSKKIKVAGGRKKKSGAKRKKSGGKRSGASKAPRGKEKVAIASS